VLIRAALAGGLAIVLVAAAIVLSDREPRMAGSNLVPELGFLPELAPGQRLCQAQELVPRDADSVRILVGTFGGPGGGLDVTLDTRGRRLTQGSLPPGHGQGHLTVPIRPLSRTTGDATLCIANRGDSKVALGGSDRVSPFARVGGAELPGRARVEYMRPGRESWWSLAGEVVHRFGYGKAGLLGSWTLFAALLLMLVAGAAAAVALLRMERS
jgi:hypothetical protein